MTNVDNTNENTSGHASDNMEENSDFQDMNDVITSYSIHYTKLYELINIIKGD